MKNKGGKARTQPFADGGPFEFDFSDCRPWDSSNTIGNAVLVKNEQIGILTKRSAQTNHKIATEKGSPTMADVIKKKICRAEISSSIKMSSSKSRQISTNIKLPMAFQNAKDLRYTILSTEYRLVAYKLLNEISYSFSPVSFGYTFNTQTWGGLHIQFCISYDPHIIRSFKNK